MKTLQLIASWPPYALGWVAGTLVRFVLWVALMIKTGYLEGIGDTPWQSRQQSSRF